jgi:hypothetical protein
MLTGLTSGHAAGSARPKRADERSSQRIGTHHRCGSIQRVLSWAMVLCSRQNIEGGRGVPSAAASR